MKDLWKKIWAIGPGATKGKIDVSPKGRAKSDSNPGSSYRHVHFSALGRANIMV